MASQVVYTALFGQTEKLLEQRVANSSKARFLCFTDNPRLTSNTWEIIRTEPLLSADPRRSQRAIKIRGHHVLEEFDHWLYMDNTVRLKVAPEDILSDWLARGDWAAISHDAHETLWQEFDANLSMSKDVEERINEQLYDYSVHHKAALDQHPLWNGLFARRRNDATKDLAELWFDHVLRYSARDQLSFMVALSQRPVSLKRIEGKPRVSRWHDWPHREGETVASKATRRARTTGLKPLSEELEIARQEAVGLREELKSVQEELLRFQDKQFFGLSRVLRRLAEVRTKWRRAKRRAKKRR